MSKMDNNLDDELLSAFIDGELTDAERAAVEARLENDPAARKLEAELRALRSTLQSLPRETLTEDIRSAVLNQIGDNPVPLPPVRLSPARRLMWPALAIAAALLLMFVSEDPLDPVDEVARVEEADADRSGEIPRERMAGERIAAFEAAEPEQPRLEAASPAADSAPAVDESTALATRAAPSSELVDDSVHGGPVAADGNLGVVHLTLTDFHSGAERFHRLLLANGVQLVEEPSSAAAVGADAPPSVEAMSDGPSEGANVLAARATGRASTSTNAGALPGAPATEPPASAVRPEPELVLVEAAPEQIEQILAECAEDTEAIAEVAVDPTAGGTNSAPLANRLIDYQQYSRSAAARDQVQSYAVTREQQGVIAALNSLPPEPLVGDAQSEHASGQGWAARVPTDQRPEQWQQLNTQYKKIRSQDAQSTTQPQEGSSPAPPMRVLFLLHPSEAVAPE